MECSKDCVNFVPLKFQGYCGNTCNNFKSKSPIQLDNIYWYDKKYKIVKVYALNQHSKTVGVICIIDDNKVIVDKDGLRPIKPSDWVREIDGVKYRAYEDEGGAIILYMINSDGYKTRGSYFITELFCELAKIPVMPYSLSSGNYLYPE